MTEQAMCKSLPDVCRNLPIVRCCKKCASEYVCSLRRKNKDRFLKREAKSRERRRESLRDYNRAYFKNVFIKSHPGYNTYKTNQRRSRLLQATPVWLSEDQRQQLVAFYDNKPKGMHVDHIVPLKSDFVCGLNVPWNLQYLTPQEN